MKAYSDDKVDRLGAALAYYTIFSLPAIILISTGIVGMLLGKSEAQGEMNNQIVAVLGESTAGQIEEAVGSLSQPAQNRIAAIVGGLLLLFGATGVFYGLQGALNVVFGSLIGHQPVGFKQIVVRRLISLGMVLTISLILFTTLVLNAVLIIVRNFVVNNQQQIQERVLKHELALIAKYLNFFTQTLFDFLNFGITIFIVIMFFATTFKVLPDVRLPWRLCFRGAALTSVLFWLGKFGIEKYLSSTNVTSTYGAAGSVVAILVWVYYSAQMVFIGAEYMKVYAEYKGIYLTERKLVTKVTLFKPIKH